MNFCLIGLRIGVIRATAILIIDNYAKDHRFEVLSRDDILVNAYVADKFACRPSIGQRSEINS